MLVVSLKVDEWIQIGEAWVQIKKSSSSIEKKITLIIRAPEHVRIIRQSAKKLESI